MSLSPEEIAALEVRPEKCGWYFVTLCQYEKDDPEDPDCIKEYLYFDTLIGWEYCGEYLGSCYVSEIIKGDAE